MAEMPPGMTGTGKILKVKKHGYRFTNKNNTRGGILATILAACSLILLIVGVVISYRHAGKAGSSVGMFGLLAFISSMAGIIFGLRSFKKQDGFYLFSWIGTISSGILWLILCAVIVWGL